MNTTKSTSSGEREIGTSAARVVYLEGAYDLLRADLLPEAPAREGVALAYSFPSRGAVRTRRGRIGECHYAGLTGAAERQLIVVHPSEFADELRVLAVLAHEMVHASLDPRVGHKAPFARLVVRMGLEGKPTATVVGDRFTKWASLAAAALPAFPGGGLELMGRVVQGTRQRLHVCQCEPPKKVRCGRDELGAICLDCGTCFTLAEGARGRRVEGPGTGAHE